MFDSVEELLRKIQLGEDSSLELKVVMFSGEKIKAPSADALADELVAFANSRDGVVVLGVDDKTRDIVGVPMEKLDALEQFVMNLCNDVIEPPLPVSTFRIELPDLADELKPVLKIEVQKSLFVHKSPRGYFHRIGSSKRQMPSEYLARLFQQRSQARLIRFEEQSVPDTRMADLDESLYTRFISQVTDPPDVALLKRGLLTRDDRGQTRVTVAGILMCARNPENYLPNAFIEAVSYRGRNQDSNNQLDAQKITGTLDEQIIQAMVFLHRNQKVSATKKTYRMETPQFSERAVFEAVVNAVAHRDYSVHGSKIRFFLFDDRLELYSPGALPNTITVETLAFRQTTRNELITSLLAECRVSESAGLVRRKYFMEKRGEGVPIILLESEALSGRSPEYKLLDESELFLTIYAAKKQENNE